MKFSNAEVVRLRWQNGEHAISTRRPVAEFNSAQLNAHY